MASLSVARADAGPSTSGPSARITRATRADAGPIDWRQCHQCQGRFKGLRGLTQHKRSCDKREAQRQEQAALGASSARRGVRVPPNAAHWTWIRSIDLESELLPRPGDHFMPRIAHAVRGDVARAFTLPLQRIQTDPADEGGWALLLMFPLLVLGRLRRGGDAGHSDLRERCRRFESGEWQALLSEFRAASEAAATQADQTRDGAPSEEDDGAHRLRRCLALCRVGELSRAARALDPARMAPDSEATLQVLRELHPDAPSVLPDWLPDFQPDDAFQLDPDAVRRALEGASRRSAGGLSGMIYELYRDILLEHPATFLPFFAVCSHMARGEVPPRAQAALSSCRLLALAKTVPDGPDGVRPIAIAEVLQRLVSRSIALQMRDAFQQFFSPLQFAVSTPGGCESIVAGIRALLDVDPELLVMQVDLANAFNEVDRTAIFEELRAHFPALIPFTRLFYASSSRLMYRRADQSWVALLSQTGTRQGDPLGMFYFCLAYQRALSSTHAAFPDVHLPSYADDTHVVARSDRALAAFHHLVAQVGELNLRVKLPKCTAYSPSPISPDLSIPPEISRPSDGIRVLGAPVGTAAFQETFVADRLDHFSRSLDSLQRLEDSQCALRLLTSVYVQRPSYLMRTTPLSPALSQHLHAYDLRIRSAAESIVGATAFDGPEGQLARSQMTLPISLGGLGLRSTSEIAPAALLGSWCRSASMVVCRFPSLSRAVTTDVETGGLPFQAALRAARDVLPASARQLLPPFHQLGLQAIPDIQERLTRAIEMERAEALRESVGDSVGRARLLSQTAPGAGAFLTAVPLMQSLRFTHECFRTALRTRLGLPHPAIAGVRRCECGEELQEGILAGQHLLRCGRGGERTLTHDGIRDVVFVILREAGLSVRREARGIFPLRGNETEGRVMDLVAADPQGGPRLLVDVTVADPLQAPVTAAAVERGHAARAAEALKTTKYSDHSPDDTLVPAAIETYGCLGGQFDSLLRTCARRAAALRVDESQIGEEASRLLRYYRQRVSVSLQRSQARAIHHRAARAVQSTLGARPLAMSGFIGRGDLLTAAAVDRIADF